MTVQTDIDTAMATLKTAIAAYTASAGNQTVLASWLVSQIKIASCGRGCGTGRDGAGCRDGSGSRPLISSSTQKDCSEQG
jgi:hypothetical protein